MNRIVTFLLAFVCTCVATFAQTDVDALRYSQLAPTMTARTVGISGAIGALGADLGAMNINPAGLAMYRSSEFMFSPSIVSMRTNSEYFGNQTSSFKYNFNFSNVGFAGAMLNGDGRQKDDWASSGFAFGVNRLANFHNSTFFEGVNAKSSMVDNFMERIQRNGLSPSTIESDYLFDLNLAWQTFLIDTVHLDTNGTYDYFTAIPNGGVAQSKSINSRGAINEYFISFAGNYGNKLYIGGTLGFPHLRYIEESTYTETDIDGSVPVFNSFAMNNYLKTSGMGINLKLGLIYRVNNFLRLGGAVHSPTYYSLNDDYYSTMSSEFESISFDWQSPQGDYSYGLTTPWRVVGSAAFIFKKYGFLSMDYEFVDYAYAFYNNSAGSIGDGVGTSNVNQTIAGKYGPASNLRIGAEGRFDVFRIRAGYAYRGSPFQQGVAEAGFDNKAQDFSFGLGVREEGYYIDLGYVKSLRKTAHFPYTLSTSNDFEASLNRENTSAFVMTVGFTF